LHGIGASAERWAKVIPSYMIILGNCPDIVGFGYSDKPTVEYNIPFFVKFLEDFLNSLGIKKTSIAGSSFGGLVAAEFAIKNSQMVNKLVLVSPAGTMKSRRENWRSIFSRLFIQHMIMLGEPSSIWHLTPNSYRTNCRRFYR
jgi:pimeloyl-ACP methyl ester carboxylesterase